MRNSRYSIVVIIRVILIGINSFILVWLLINFTRPATSLFAFILLIIQIIGLIWYHNRILRDLANFLLFLEENDTTLSFSAERIERNFNGLVTHLNNINRKIQLAGLEKEQQFHYLQAVVKQIDTGIIAYDQEGNVEIFNSAARELLGLRNLRKIETLVDTYPELAACTQGGKKSFHAPIKIKKHETELILSVKLGLFRFGSRTIRLITLQNIKPELEAGELEAWRKLIRIQRHEFINSITPITTLTTAIKRRFLSGDKRKNMTDIKEEHIEDALKSIDVIEERSKGLIDFIERFKSLTEVPKLRTGPVRLSKLIENIDILFSRELNAGNIRLISDLTPKTLTITGDEKLLEQVFINLVKNSIEAIREPGGQIIIRGAKTVQHLNAIQVIDNGSGIEKTTIESIFIPSYTTKENGSGIGLSITRQIINLHGGSIKAISNPGVETIFEIFLPDVISRIQSLR